MGEPTFDFHFTLRPISVLKNAIEALSNPKFNPSQEAVIEVSQAGCEIMVWRLNYVTLGESFGYLRLKAAGLEAFQCRNPLRRSFKLAGIPALFKSAISFEATSVTMFVVEGSNKLSFRCGSTTADFGLGVPVTVDLDDIYAPFANFPNNSYVFEAVIPSQVVRGMFAYLESSPQPSSGTVTVTLQPATIEVMMGQTLTGSLNENEEAQEYLVTVRWQHWKALESATHTANKCSVYLVTVPAAGIMVRFHIPNLGDLVFLDQAHFENDEIRGLPILGHFRRLN